MSGAHTPGPWSVHATMRDCVTFRGRGGTENLFLQNVDGYFACQHEADARLIAAAPDLLEALSAMVKMVTRTPMVELPEVAQAVEAITKATGVQP